MATVTFAVTNPNEGIEWQTSLSNVYQMLQVKDSIQYNDSIGVDIVSPFSAFLFNVNSFAGYPGEGTEYVTWRSNIPPTEEPHFGQYPATGKSIDIWSQEFYTSIMDNDVTWDSLVGTYQLSPTKWSLVYDYDNNVNGALSYSRGGTLTISIS